MKGVVICGGAIKEYARLGKYLDNAGIIICADGGAIHLDGLNVVPDILVGDFDSIPANKLDELTQKGVETIRFPVEKDMTDSELAVEIAVKKGCSSVVILGGLGSRLDHSMANVFLLKKLLDEGIDGVIADEHNEARIIDKSIVLEKEECYKVTLLPVTDKVLGVFTEGLSYPLADATMKLGSSWGVSNEFSGEKACVTIGAGLLLVIKSRD